MVIAKTKLWLLGAIVLVELLGLAKTDVALGSPSYTPPPLLSTVFLWLLHIQSLPVLERRLLWLALVDTIVSRTWHVLPKYLLVHWSLEKAGVVRVLRVPDIFSRLYSPNLSPTARYRRSP